MPFLEGLALVTLVSVASFGLVDAVKAALKKTAINDIGCYLYPIFAVVFCVYVSLLLHANIFAALGATVFGTAIEAYVVTGILASLGSKGIHDRFGSFLSNSTVATEVRLSKLSEVLAEKVDDNKIIGA